MKIQKYNNFINDKIDEGVGDVYAEKKFGIPNRIKEIEKRYKTEKEENIIGYVNETQILKNPKSLKNIPFDAKGLIDKTGNMYFCDPKKAVHWQMMEVLVEKGIIPLITNWNVITPKEYLTVQRSKDTNIIAVGESNRFAYGNMNIEKHKAIEHSFNKAKLKNTIWKFVNKSIREL